MKLMLDTNVLISALVFGGKARKVMLKLIGAEHQIYVSDYVADELPKKCIQNGRIRQICF